MEDDQDRYLDDAKNIVKEQAYFMKKALDKAILRDALKHAAIMLAELKTPLLSPRNYYQLVNYNKIIYFQNLAIIFPLFFFLCEIFEELYTI